jgi:hypothetical protein
VDPEEVVRLDRLLLTRGVQPQHLCR